MARKLYPTDLTEQQWCVLKTLIPLLNAGRHPRTINIREIVNAMFYILVSSCAWRLLPHDFPSWSTVYYYFLAMTDRASMATVQPSLAVKSPLTCAAIIDSQLVKTTQIAEEVGYDGGKLVKGHKRHVLADTLGLLLEVFVGAANLNEKAGAKV